MFQYKAKGGKGQLYIVILTMIINILLLFAIDVINDFVMKTCLFSALIIVDIYYLYYIILAISIIYILQEDYLEIRALFGLKKVKIPYNKILEFKNNNDKIKGLQLLGVGKRTFAFGRFYISNIGACRMFLTNNKNGFFIKTTDIVFGISPENLNDFKDKLMVKVNTVKTIDFTRKKAVPLHNDKYFMVPFIINTILTIVYILNPLYLYFKGKFKTDKMPITFNEHFYPIKWGTSTLFVKTQVTYGILVMGVLFCLYYVSHIYAKYDKKASYMYVYIPLIIIVILFVFQMVILKNFN